MNAFTLPPDAAFDRATEAVNAWRGRCLAIFAAVEAMVTQTLVAIAAAAPGTPLPHLAGHRAAELATLLERREETEALAALTCFRRHDALRTFLAHGETRITLDRHDRWHALLTVHTLRAREYSRPFLIVDADEAAEIASTLGRDRQRLSARLAPFYRGSDHPPVALRIGESVAQTASASARETALDSVRPSL